MVNAHDIVKSLNGLSQQQARLKNKFKEFFDVAKSISDNHQPLAKSLVFEDHLDKGYFKASFCEQVFQFRFSLALKEDGSSCGLVSFFGTDPAEPSKQKLISTFTFLSSGSADVEVPENISHPIFLNSEEAAYIVYKYIYQGLMQ